MERDAPDASIHAEDGTDHVSIDLGVSTHSSDDVGTMHQHLPQRDSRR
jgi:hypothetical protein